MSPGSCQLELFVDGAWVVAGSVHVEDAAAGFGTPSRFEYDFDYLEAMSASLGAVDARAVSCRYRLGYDEHREPRWPAFLFDLVPSGAARRHWEARLGLPNNSSSDWSILVQGAGNAPGNVRVAQAVEEPATPHIHPGFDRAEVVARAANFIEYARAAGAPVSGSSGAGGDSPKFLLREDTAGRWHADGALPDEHTQRCWIVKFPRTREDRIDRVVLEAEAAYHRVATRVGIRTFGRVEWEADCLFVERFDRVVKGDGSLERLALESLSSLAGIAEFGALTPKESFAGAISRFVNEPSVELREFLRRDVFDVAMGNTDNHGRNTSVLKHSDGRVALAPLYDFAPMFLDRSGIARVSRWSGDAGFPDWGRAVESLARFGVDSGETRRELRDLAGAVSDLPRTMRECDVPREVIEACANRIERVHRSLENC